MKMQSPHPVIIDDGRWGYVPTANDLGILHRWFPDRNPKMPSWPNIEAELVIAGHDRAKLIALNAPTLLKMFDETKRKREPRRLDVLIAAFTRFHDTLHATTIPVDSGGRRVDGIAHAVALSEASQSLSDAVAGSWDDAMAAHAKPATLPAGITVQGADTPAGPWTELPAGAVRVSAMSIGGDGADATLLAALDSAARAVAFPTAQWNAMQAKNPGANHQRWHSGDVVSADTVARVESAAKLLRLATPASQIRAGAAFMAKMESDPAAPTAKPGDGGLADAGETLSLSQYVDRAIDLLEEAERIRLDAQRKAQDAVEAGDLDRLRDDPSSVLGSAEELHKLKHQFDAMARPLVIAGNALNIDATPLDDFIRTGRPELVAGAIRVLRRIQGEALKRQVPAIQQQPHADKIEQIRRGVDALYDWQRQYEEGLVRVSRTIENVAPVSVPDIMKQAYLDALAEHDERKAKALPQGQAVQPAMKERPAVHQAEWLANAMLLVRDHPDWSDAEIARRVGKSAGTLSRSNEYKMAAKLARGDKTDRPKGYITVDPDSGAGDVEGTAPPAAPVDDRSDRGKPISGSRYVREYCAECAEPMKVAPDKVGTNPVCDDCAE